MDGYAEWVQQRGQRRSGGGLRGCGGLALGCCLLGGLSSGRARAQDTAAQAANAPETGTGIVSGSVTDLDGDAVPGAKVTLNGTRETIADELGAFAFTGVPAGAFRLEVTAPNFKGVGTKGVLVAGQTTDLPAMSMAASSSTAVTVTTTMAEVGEAEVKMEETQKLLGALPNYFVVYDWHAPPLSQKQKFELSYKSTFDPVTILISEVSAGVQEATNELSGYGKGGNGFVKRAAANQANVVIGTFTGGYLFPRLLHQDPRYFYMGPDRGSVTKRFFYALSTAFITRGDNGKWQPNYSSVLGDLASGAAANAYYPASDRHGWSTVIEGGLLGAAFDGVGNVVQEFLYKHLTPHAPNYPGSDPQGHKP